MGAKNFQSKKPLLAVLLALVTGMPLNVPITVRGAKLNLPETRPAAATERGDEKKVKEAFDKLPLYFIESQPGDDGQAGYYVQGKDKSLFFTPQGIAVTLETAPNVEPNVANDARAARAAKTNEDGEVEEGRPERDIEAQRWTVQLDFLGANLQAKPSGQEQTPARISYFTGSKAESRAGLKTYGSIIYRDLWPGIDLVYSGTATRVKHEFVVRPGGDPREIKLAWRGASSVKLNRDGQLEIATPVGSFTDDQPYSYQEADGKRAQVKTAYQLEPVEEEGVQVYGFAVAEYDRDQTLVIDPMMIIYCGYIGGGRDDMALDVAVDGDGYAYVTGVTYSDASTNTSGKFPATVGPDLTFNGGQRDAFVAKIKADGSGLVYCGYIGGSAGEYGHGIAVDDLGKAYVTGITHSTEQTFPVRTGPDLSYNSIPNTPGSGDAFVAKVNATGTELEYCGYIGGNDTDTGRDIAVDSDYNAYIVGNTQSANFFTLTGPGLSYGGGDSDVFVVKLQSDGKNYSYSGFIGGTGTDYGVGIAVDSVGNAYLTGETYSDEQSFPVKNGPHLTLNNGVDGFVAKVNATGQELDYCGYIGGGTGEGIAVNSQGEAYICGLAGSSLQVVVGPSLTSGGSTDAFVARLNSSGTGFIYCGYLGGSGSDAATSIALDTAGRAYVTGVTHSSDFPVGKGLDSSFNGSEADAFITCVRPNGASLYYSSYLGGSGYEYATGIAVVPTSNIQVNLYGAPVVVVGRTTSGQRFPTPTYVRFPVKTGPGVIYRGAGGLGWGDAFVAKIGPEIPGCPNGCPAEP